MMKLRRKLLPLIMTGILFIAGCGTNSDAPAPASETPSDPGTATDTPSDAEPDDTVAEPKSPVVIPFADGGHALTYLTFYVARGLGYFADEGIELDTVHIASAAGLAQAIIGGERDIASLGVTGVYSAVAQDRDIRLFAAVSNRPTTGFTLRKEVADELASRGITPESPIADRVTALKGLTIASPATGSLTDLMIRAVISEYGLNPETDITITPVADQNALVALVREGRADGLAFSSPVSDVGVAEGWGVKWINLATGDVPSMANMLFVGVAAKDSWLQQNRDIAIRFTRALWRATNYLNSDLDGARRVVREFFPDMDEDLFNAAFDASVGAFLAGPVITEKDFEASLELWAKSLDQAPPPIPFEKAIDASIALEAKPDS